MIYDDDQSDSFITATELANILDVTKGAVSKWLKDGILYSASGKSCKTKISCKEVTNAVKDDQPLEKYKNLWNRFIDKK